MMVARDRTEVGTLHLRLTEWTVSLAAVSFLLVDPLRHRVTTVESVNAKGVPIFLADLKPGDHNCFALRGAFSRVDT